MLISSNSNCVHISDRKSENWVVSYLI